jgi:hypothetical protein
MVPPRVTGNQTLSGLSPYMQGRSLAFSFDAAKDATPNCGTILFIF